MYGSTSHLLTTKNSQILPNPSSKTFAFNTKYYKMGLTMYITVCQPLQHAQTIWVSYWLHIQLLFSLVVLKIYSASFSNC